MNISMLKNGGLRQMAMKHVQDHEEFERKAEQESIRRHRELEVTYLHQSLCRIFDTEVPVHEIVLLETQWENDTPYAKAVYDIDNMRFARFEQGLLLWLGLCPTCGQPRWSNQFGSVLALGYLLQQNPIPSKHECQKNEDGNYYQYKERVIINPYHR